MTKINVIEDSNSSLDIGYNVVIPPSIITIGEVNVIFFKTVNYKAK